MLVPAHACCMCISGFILMHVHFNNCAGIDCGNDSIGISIKFSSQVSCKAIAKYLSSAAVSHIHKRVQEQ